MAERGCDCCNYPDVDVEWYENSKPGKQPGEPRGWWLCQLCSHTHTSNMLLIYPRQYDPSAALVAQTVCYVGNVILAAANEIHKANQFLEARRESSSEGQTQGHGSEEG